MRRVPDVETPASEARPESPPDRRRSMLRSFSWVLVANLARQVSFLVVNAVLFERLTRSTFGAVSLGFGYMTVFVGLGDFGVRQIGWREIARRPGAARDLTAPLTGVKLTTLALAALGYVVLMPVLWESAAPASLYLLFGLGIALNATTFDFPLFGVGRVDLVAKYSTVAFAIYLVGCLVFVHADERAWLVPSFFAFAMAVLLVLEVAWFHRTYGAIRPAFRLAAIRRTLRASWPLGVGETLNRLAASYPLILIGMLVGSESVGNYRIGEILFSFLAQLGHLLATAGFSHLAHTFQHRRSEVSSSLWRMLWPTLLGALVAGLGLALVGPPALKWAFADIAEETSGVLRVLGVALVFAAPARLLKSLLASINRQGSMLFTNAATVAIGALVGWVLIPVAGITGMAFAVLVAELGTLVLLVIIYRRALLLSPDRV